ncbi:hypothetical protein CRE_06435 [Caenorhabditis remanei]|uniref:Uncharacterized protein n=1 Tax=Caenorhabditis remanei TaxID=31234 RepID=E3M0X2_CAERE|nr:hypothetical protein CRE_06435 [Caenorhabditis remanei]
MTTITNSNTQLQKIVDENEDCIKQKSDKKSEMPSRIQEVDSSDEDDFDERVEKLFNELDDFERKILEAKESYTHWEEDRKREEEEYNTDDYTDDEEDEEKK